MGIRDDLALRFLARAGNDVGEAKRLAPALQRALAEARRVWPTVELPDEDFIDWLAARLPADEDAEVGLSRLKVADLYLACAAARGCPEAVALFESAIIRRVGQFIAGVNLAITPAFVSEVAQALRIKLFVGSDGHGKLAQYAGRGALASWACAVAIRIARDLRRSEHQPEDGAQAFEVLAASDDPQLDLLRHRYRNQFRAAIEQVIAELPAQSRTLLRLYFIEHLSAARIGVLYRVHETTALRWIERVRATVIEQVRSSLSKSLRLSVTEFNDLVVLMRSQFDVSVGRLLDSGRQDERVNPGP